MLALCVVAAVAAPVDLGGASTCRLMSQIRIDGDYTACCESCLAPYLLDTSWYTQSTIKERTSFDDKDSVQQLDVDDGSGNFESVRASDSKEVMTIISKQNTQSAPCGKCVSANECLETAGYVNTWHRLCQRTRT